MATSASAMPGATTARSVEPCGADAGEGRHDAPHGAEQPDEGREAGGGRQERHAPLQLVHLGRRRPQQRAIERPPGSSGLDAGAWTLGLAGRPWRRAAAAGSARRSRPGRPRPAGCARATCRRPGPPRTWRSCGRRRGTTAVWRSARGQRRATCERMMPHETTEKASSTSSAAFETRLASAMSSKMLSAPRTGASASWTCCRARNTESRRAQRHLRRQGVSAPLGTARVCNRNTKCEILSNP